MWPFKKKQEPLSAFLQFNSKFGRWEANEYIDRNDIRKEVPPLMAALCDVGMFRMSNLLGTMLKGLIGQTHHIRELESKIKFLEEQKIEENPRIPLP